jgi:hypothetical protein
VIKVHLFGGRKFVDDKMQEWAGVPGVEVSEAEDVPDLLARLIRGREGLMRVEVLELVPDDVAGGERLCYDGDMETPSGADDALGDDQADAIGSTRGS